MSCSVHPEKWISINSFSVSFGTISIFTPLSYPDSFWFTLISTVLFVLSNNYMYLKIQFLWNAVLYNDQIWSNYLKLKNMGTIQPAYSVTSVLLHFLDFSRLTQCFLHCIGHFIFKLYINSKLYALFFRKKRRKNQGLRSNSARQGYNHIRDKSVSLVIRLFVTDFSPVVSVGDAT